MCSFEVSSVDRHLWDLEYHVLVLKPRIIFSKCSSTMKSSLASGQEESGVVLVHQQDVPWRPSGKTVGFILIFPPSRKVRPTAVHKQKEMPAVRLITPS